MAGTARGQAGSGGVCPHHPPAPPAAAKRAQQGESPPCPPCPSLGTPDGPSPPPCNRTAVQTAGERSGARGCHQVCRASSQLCPAVPPRTQVGTPRDGDTRGQGHSGMGTWEQDWLGAPRGPSTAPLPPCQAGDAAALGWGQLPCTEQGQGPISGVLAFTSAGYGGQSARGQPPPQLLPASRSQLGAGPPGAPAPPVPRLASGRDPAGRRRLAW